MDEKPTDVKIHKIRITLTSTQVQTLERTTSQILKNAKDSQLKTKGPVRMPTKKLVHTTRRTPCGQGSKTWDRYEMRIHKRVLDLESPGEIIKKITSIPIETGVEVEVTILQ